MVWKKPYKCAEFLNTSWHTVLFAQSAMIQVIKEDDGGREEKIEVVNNLTLSICLNDGVFVLTNIENRANHRVNKYSNMSQWSRYKEKEIWRQLLLGNSHKIDSLMTYVCRLSIFPATMRTLASVLLLWQFHAHFHLISSISSLHFISIQCHIDAATVHSNRLLSLFTFDNFKWDSVHKAHSTREKLKSKRFRAPFFRLTVDFISISVRPFVLLSIPFMWGRKE